MIDRIEAEALGKRYTLRHLRAHASLREQISSGLGRAVQRLRGVRDTQVAEPFWALSDVSFRVREGDRLGIIGKNGAGKSTLLKILSRVTEPSTGKVTMRGRVSSLLEIGTGFHPELSGRENVFLNGAILGMNRAEIKRRFDAIVAFAEVERFLDTPVKRYSSGMYMRLAFAIAAHLEPDILIVDEVLAVGDASFQRKCLGKMQEAGQGGRTVLFVSHNLGAVRQLCNVALVMDGGRTRGVVPCDEGLALYQSQRSEEQYQTIGDGPLRLGNVRLNGASVEAMPETFTGDALRVSLDYACDEPGKDLWLNVAVKALVHEGGVFYSDNHLEDVMHRAARAGRAEVEFPSYPLAPGRYAIDVHGLLDGTPVLAETRVLEFTVVPVPCFASQTLHVSYPALLMPSVRWRFEAQ
jgi:lipopolysaccharide transport system ATP-binding protein